MLIDLSPFMYLALAIYALIGGCSSLLAYFILRGSIRMLRNRREAVLRAERNACKVGISPVANRA